MVLRCNEHASDPGDVQFTSLEDLTSRLKGLDVPVHDVHSQEKRLVSTYVGKSDFEDLGHPVNHFCTEDRCDLVMSQVVWFQLTVFLDFSEVGIYRADIVTHQAPREAGPGRQSWHLVDGGCVQVIADTHVARVHCAAF